MRRILALALIGLFVSCATVDPDTYKPVGYQYSRTDGWYVDSSGNWQQIVNGTATGAYFSSTGDFTTSGAVGYTNFTASGTCAVTGNATFGGTMGITGATTITGATVMSSSLSVVTTTTGIDFADMKIFDSRSTPLTVAAGDDDDLTYYEGTFGTNAATLETVDCGGLNDTTQKAVFTFVLPSTLPAGATVNLVANAGMRTTVADQGATLDFSCYVADYANEDGTMSGDLNLTAAQSVNSTTFDDKTFNLDDDAAGYVLAAGDTIECLVTALCDDDGDAAGGITVVINRLVVATAT